MRITFVIQGMGLGGAQRVASILLNSWVERGHEVSLLTFDDGSQTPAFHVSAKVQWRRLHLSKKSSNPFAALLRNLSRVSLLSRAIRESKPDIVVSFIHRTNILTLLACRRLNVPVVVSERIAPGVRSIGAAWEWLRQKCYPKAAAVVVQNYTAQKYFETICGSCLVIPNPVPMPPDRLGTSIRSAPPTIIAMGRLERQKRIDILLSAFALTRADHPEWCLRILGDGSLRHDLEKMAVSLDIAPAVSFAGALKDPWPALQEATIFAHTSELEGFPNAVCEAMAAGLPVIATHSPGAIGEIVTPGETGMLVELNNAHAFAAALSQLMSDREECRRMGSNAKNYVQRFSEPDVLEQWEDLLLRLTKKA
ncbi:MAG: glycosyltransferase family 4 protein [Bdellovibrionales bacterium]|nr:glycosyltransferase family 4 protein [Bdellovibrionales bacterium]